MFFTKQDRWYTHDDDDDFVVQKKNKDVPTHASNAIFMYFKKK